jgi:hypothetical protein
VVVHDRFCSTGCCSEDCSPQGCPIAGASTAVGMALVGFKLQASLAAMRFAYGVAFGVLKIAWIVLAAVSLRYFGRNRPIRNREGVGGRNYRRAPPQDPLSGVLLWCFHHGRRPRPIMKAPRALPAHRNRLLPRHSRWTAECEIAVRRWPPSTFRAPLSIRALFAISFNFCLAAFADCIYPVTSL